MFAFSFPFQTKSEFTVEFSVSDSQGVSVTSHFMVCSPGGGERGGWVMAGWGQHPREGSKPGAEARASSHEACFGSEIRARS